MGAQTILAASASCRPLLSIHSSSFNSSFPCVSLGLPRHSVSLTLAAPPGSKKPLAVVAAASEAASALNCASDDEALVNLAQDYEGLTGATIVDSEILLSSTNVEPADELGPVAAVPKKRTSRSKTRIRKNVWKRKGYVAALKAYSLAKSILTGKSTSFMTETVKKDT